MKAHIIAIIAASLLFAGCNRGPTETQQDNAHFAYQLDWNNAGINVSLTLTHPNTDTMTLYYCDDSWGGQKDIFTCVKDLQADGCTVLPDSAHFKIQLVDFKKQPIQLTYRIEQSLPDTGINCPSEVFRPNMTSDMLYGLGVHFFFLPDTQGEISYPMQVRWGNKPDFPVFCLYNAGKGLEDYEGETAGFVNTVIVGDRGLHIDTVIYSRVTNYVVTAPRQLAEYNDASLKDFLRLFYASALRFWEQLSSQISKMPVLHSNC